MKKQLFILGMAILAACTAGAHNRNAAAGNAAQKANTAAKIVHKGTGGVSGMLITPAFDQNSNCYLVYPTPTDRGGYITGVNGYGDKEKMMSYHLTEFNAALPAKVDTVFAVFSQKYVSGNGTVTAKVYAADANGNPGTLLGTSSGVSVSSIDTSGATATSFAFASPVTLTSLRFYVAVDFSALYATRDTLALLNVDDGCTDVDTTRAWEKWDDNTITSVAGSWGVYTEMAIFPYITATGLSVNGYVKNNFGATCYPQPANTNMVVAFTGQDNGSTSLTIRDITGKAVSNQQVTTTKGTACKVSFDVSNISRGLYFVEIASGNNKGMIKIVLQ